MLENLDVALGNVKVLFAAAWAGRSDAFQAANAADAAVDFAHREAERAANLFSVADAARDKLVEDLSALCEAPPAVTDAPSEPVPEAVDAVLAEPAPVDAPEAALPAESPPEDVVLATPEQAAAIAAVPDGEIVAVPEPAVETTVVDTTEAVPPQ